MSRTHEKRNARERRLLCAAAVACYTTALASLAAVGYSLSVLALSAAGQQLTAVYTTLGAAAR